MSYNYGNDAEQKQLLDAIGDKLREGVAQYKSELDEISDLAYKTAQLVANGYSSSPDLSGAGISHTPIHQALQRSDDWKNFTDKENRTLTKARVQLDSGSLLEYKNTILGESGSPQAPDDTIVAPDRMAGVVLGKFRALDLLDFLPKERTTSNQIQFTREASWTNDAAETAEGQQKPESDITFELVELPVVTIAHWLKTSKQVLDDTPWLMSTMELRMGHGTRARLQRQVILGDGSAPNMTGIADSGNHTAFSPVTGETALDSLNRAKYTLEAGDYSADFLLMNPGDWGTIERQHRGDSDDAYTAGDGDARGFVSSGLPPQLWGVPVVRSNDIPAGKFCMGHREALKLVMRQDAVFEAFEQDGQNVTHNLVTLRSEMRAALAVLVPAAILYGDLVAA